MKSKEQRKRRRREINRIELKARISALTMGVSRCFTKAHETTPVMTQKHRVMPASDIPRKSSKTGKVTTLGRQ